MMVSSDLLVVPQRCKEELKSASTEHGEPSAIFSGLLLIETLCADSLDSHNSV